MKTIKEEISTFDTPQYKRVMAACKERDAFPTQAWIPDKEENSESKAKTKIILLETYTKMHGSMKDSAEKKRIGKLIEELKMSKEMERPVPLAPMSPFSNEEWSNNNKEDLEEVKEKLTKEKAFNAIVEGMRILGWDK